MVTDFIEFFRVSADVSWTWEKNTEDDAASYPSICNFVKIALRVTISNIEEKSDNLKNG